RGVAEAPCHELSDFLFAAAQMHFRGGRTRSGSDSEDAKDARGTLTHLGCPFPGFRADPGPMKSPLGDVYADDQQVTAATPRAERINFPVPYRHVAGQRDRRSNEADVLEVTQVGGLSRDAHL